MTVSNKKLVDLLVQKTDLDKAEVEQQLQLLIGKIHDEVEENGNFRVEGLGEFSLKDGSLQFKAEDDLATEINHKYAGMKPLELIGAYKDTSDEVVAEKKEEQAASEIGSGIEEYREEREEEPIIEELVPADEPMAEEEKPEEVLPELNADEATSSFELDEEVVEEEEQLEQLAEPVIKEATPVKEEVEKEVKKEGELSKDPIGKMLVAAVVIIALGVSGWLVYDMGLWGGGQGSGSEREGEQLQNVTVAQNDLAGTIDTDKSANDGAGVDSVAQKGTEGETTSEQNATKPISNERSIAEESRQSIYGLRGGAAPRATDGYTIVVHSMRNETRIRRENDKLQKEGYRTIVSSANVMDTTYWRLGLGQFKTIKDAAEAASNLPDPYKSNHFIKRIQ